MVFMRDLKPRRGVQRMRDKALRAALLAVPLGAHDGWNRYDTDIEHVLHLWADGESFDVRVDRLDVERQG